jgi:hypothetical protein
MQESGGEESSFDAVLFAEDVDNTISQKFFRVTIQSPISLTT